MQHIWNEIQIPSGGPRTIIQTYHVSRVVLFHLPGSYYCYSDLFTALIAHSQCSLITEGGSVSSIAILYSHMTYENTAAWHTSPLSVKGILPKHIQTVHQLFDKQSTRYIYMMCAACVRTPTHIPHPHVENKGLFPPLYIRRVVKPFALGLWSTAVYNYVSMSVCVCGVCVYLMLLIYMH